MNTASRGAILIAEDESVLLGALQEKFAREGYEVLSVSDGVQALAIATTRHPDLLILDIIMPKMDGLEVLHALRTQSDWGRRVPIIILTNVESEGRSLKSIREDSPAYYLMKSEWPIDRVVQKAKECLTPAPPTPASSQQ